MNDPVFFEAAQALGARVLREVRGSLQDRIDYAYKLCLSRSADHAESDRLIQYYQMRRAALEREPQLVDQLFPPEGVEGIDRAEAAAWVGVSSILLNLEEFISRE